MEAYRAELPPDPVAARLERCAVRIRKLPVGASEEQVKDWLEKLTGAVNGIHHVFIPRLSIDLGIDTVWTGEAYVYYHTPMEKESAMAVIPRHLSIYEGLQSASHMRWAWQVRQP